ncbi:hypothetical protein BGZ46_010623 [Entomortierella lignicola]|nr:hypothetical protein BGZ46_010623 [Entomortierella lignicola]
MTYNTPYHDNTACHKSAMTHSQSSRAYRHLAYSVLLLLGLLLTFASAESPSSVTKMAYATANDTTLYVLMGVLSGGTMATNQFFALDLSTQDWSPTSPPWKNLASVSTMQQAPSGFGSSMTISIDQKNLVVWGGYYSPTMIYNIESGLWTLKSPSLQDATSLKEGLKAVTDPGSGLVYIPSGADQGGSMMEYNPITMATKSLPMPSVFGGNALAYYSAIWSTQRNSIIVQGGHVVAANGSANQQLYEYSPATGTWTAITTTGQYPGTIENHCIVPDSTSALSTGIYILDLSTMSWTKGSDVDPSLARSNMACTVAADKFVAWGGDQYGNISESLGTPIIYSLKTNQWVTQFSLPGTESTPAGSSYSHIGAAIGTFIGTAIVLAMIIFFLYRRNRKNNIQQRDIESSSSSSGTKKCSEMTQTALTDVKVSLTSDSTPSKVELPPYSQTPVVLSPKRQPKLPGDLEYLEQLSQLEKRSQSPERKESDNSLYENSGRSSPQHRAYQTRHSRTPSVTTSSSQTLLQSQYNAGLDTEENSLLK